MNNTSCNQPKVVPEPEIQVPTNKERQSRVGDTRAAGSMLDMIKIQGHITHFPNSNFLMVK